MAGRIVVSLNLRAGSSARHDRYAHRIKPSMAIDCLSPRIPIEPRSRRGFGRLHHQLPRLVECANGSPDCATGFAATGSTPTAPTSCDFTPNCWSATRGSTTPAPATPHTRLDVGWETPLGRERTHATDGPSPGSI